MKTPLTMLLVCLVYELQAQTATPLPQLITFDYAARAYTPVGTNCVPQGASISYRLTNINTFAKKVLINSSLFSLNTEMPAEIATLFRIKAENAETNLKNTKEQVDKMVDQEKKANDDVAKNVNIAKASALTTAASETKQLVVFCEDYYKKARKIKRILTYPQLMAEAMADDKNNDEKKMAAALHSIGIDAATISVLKTELDSLEAAYNRVYEQYETAANAARNAKDEAGEAKIESAQEQVEKDFNALSKQYDEALDKIRNLFMKATNPANYMVTSETPIYVPDGADELEFQIQVGNADEDLSKKNAYKPVLYVNGGWKTDYSVGPVFKFISDEQYYFDGDKKLQQRSNGNALTPGIASMLHVYRRTCNGIAWGGTFGINADFKELTDVNLGFLAGASLIVGRSQKIILSSGISYSKVSRLKKDELTVGKVYDPEKTQIGDVTERILQPSAFFSISYSLTRRTVIKP